MTTDALAKRMPPDAKLLRETRFASDGDVRADLRDRYGYEGDLGEIYAATRGYHDGGRRYPAISAAVSGIHVHDSIVVLEKGSNPRPVHSSIGDGGWAGKDCLTDSMRRERPQGVAASELTGTGAE